MILIAHRGNLSGPSERENEPAYLQEAMDLGFDVEADVWVKEGCYYAGHEAPQHTVSKDFLSQKNVWCHAKNIHALCALRSDGIRCFWHQKDDFTLTSDGRIWTFPGKHLAPDAICVMPESAPGSYSLEALSRCYAICTDYVFRYQSMFKEA
jgi:hypothetical protein